MWYRYAVDYQLALKEILIYAATSHMDELWRH